jgi:hypothetical protein
MFSNTPTKDIYRYPITCKYKNRDLSRCDTHIHTDAQINRDTPTWRYQEKGGPSLD